MDKGNIRGLLHGYTDTLARRLNRHGYTYFFTSVPARINLFKLIFDRFSNES